METLVAKPAEELPFDCDYELWDPRPFQLEAFGLRPNLPFTLTQLWDHLEALGVPIQLPFDLDRLEAQGLLPRKIPSVDPDVVLYADPVTADRKVGDKFSLICPPCLIIQKPDVLGDPSLYDDHWADGYDDWTDDEVEDDGNDLESDYEEEEDDLDHHHHHVANDVWLRRSWTTVASWFGCLPH